MRNQIDELLEGKVGSPLPPSELEKVYQDGKTRYEQKRPPGYEDVAKGNIEKLRSRQERGVIASEGDNR